MTKPYLLGVLHDATARKTTYRVSQKSLSYIEFLAAGIKTFGVSAWTYREGKSRDVYVVEFSKSLLKDTRITSLSDKADYIRGYFDTDGGIAKQSQVRYYIYFAQKNYQDLEQVKMFLEDLKIVCGKIHNPSHKIDSNYWRFYVSARSYIDFARKIGSWHPEKKSYLRMKI